MRFHAAVLIGLAGFVTIGQGCEAEAPPPDPAPRVAEADDAIINGSADTTHPAVVWLYDENLGSSCSGTIIAVNGSTAYVLTAAHCSGMDYVVQANNYENCFGQGNPGCENVMAVEEQIYHPNYNDNDPGDGFDFSLIRATGANGSTPVIPAAQSPDGLSEGAQVDIVGYGQTEFGHNSVRRHKVTTVTNIYGNVFFDHFSTVCFGDSGGPALFNNTVVGVSSFVTDNSCMDYGFSVRVSTVYADWIAPFIGGAVPPPTCQSCFDGSVASGQPCSGQYNTCANDQDCIDFANCIFDCQDDACIQACIDQHPTGSQLYIAIIDCACGVCIDLCPECAGGAGGGGVGGSGMGGSSGTGVPVDPDEEWEWYPGKQEDLEPIGGCAASKRPVASGAFAAFALMALLAASRRRR